MKLLTNILILISMIYLYDIVMGKHNINYVNDFARISGIRSHKSISGK